LVASGLPGHNKPKTGKKNLGSTAEEERLKALLIKVIKRLAKHEPDALDLLDQVTRQDDQLDDSLDGVCGVNACLPAWANARRRAS
jgi:hypothetical protein